MRPDADVAVVGAGPAGVITALGLARAGLKVAVLESEAGIINSPRAIVYHWSALQGLDALGILEDAKAQGFIKQDYQFRSFATGEIFAFNLSVLEGHTPYPYNLHLGQHDLAAIALKHFTRIAGNAVRFNTRAISFSQDEEGVTVRAEGPGGAEDVRARFLVGADGARSTIRGGLGLGFDGFTWPDRVVATNVRYDFEKHGFARSTMYMDPVHWAVTAKIDNTNLWRCSYGEDASLSEEEVVNRVPAHYKALLPGGEPYELVMVAPYRMHQRAAERMRVGRVLLIGDAAHVTNPVGGLGLTAGLFDAYALAPALAAVIFGEADDMVLERWAEDRRRIFLDLVSPAACENKRRLAESDPVRQRQDYARMRRMCDDPEFLLEALHFTAKLHSAPFVARKLGAPA
jgi:3-(3-hydroxy-phenyl)propionate hydroxylase/6-hydroxy-3-succinoylpyridine 3-monooxygenase